MVSLLYVCVKLSAMAMPFVNTVSEHVYVWNIVFREQICVWCHWCMCVCVSFCNLEHNWVQ